MSRWIDFGTKWNTETTYRVGQLLKENGIPFRMPSDDMFFQSMYHLPHRDRIWGIKVRRKDLARALSLLAEEGLTTAVPRRDTSRERKRHHEHHYEAVSASVGRQPGLGFPDGHL